MEGTDRIGHFPSNFVQCSSAAVATVPVVSSASSVSLAVAVDDFDAPDPAALSFRAGQVLRLVSCDADAEWWQGKIDGPVGMFPRTYVHRVPVDGVPADEWKLFDGRGIVVDSFDGQDQQQLSLKVGQTIDIRGQFRDWLLGKGHTSHTQHTPEACPAFASDSLC